MLNESRRMASLAIVACVAMNAAGATLSADEIDNLIAAIDQAGPNGAGAAAARQASERLAEQDPQALPRLLAAVSPENPIAANYLRGAYEAIVARELAAPQPGFPVQELQAFVRDAAGEGRARRLALALLDRLDPAFSSELLPTLLDDPEFRGDAVALALSSAASARAAGDEEAARAAYRRAFEHARDAGQVTEAAIRLRELGEEADVTAHLGFVRKWQLIGPFDAPGTSGFATRFPPEDEVDLAAEYAGQNGATILWQPHETPDEMGTVNLIQAIGPVAEAVAYGYAVLRSPARREVEIRCGADDNISVWLNGEQVLAREQWLNGTRLDRFIVPVTLEEGDNRLLVKICQGPQHKDPAVGNNWTMQLRICDETGVGVEGIED